ncbi:MAG TPA: hypothetical protein VFF95_04480 [Candidatus Binatus sp.]|jgi:hypothetical protein|nr:hypothetical protein [Candidatus Binatus sp.]
MSFFPKARSFKPATTDSVIGLLPEPIAALAHLGLARACTLRGDTEKGRAAYQDFFAIWIDADPDIPILLAAKSENARLQ